MSFSRCLSVPLALCLLVTGAVGQATWTGAAGTSWSTAANWSPAVVPDASTDVIVPAVAVQPSSYLFDPSCRDLTIQSGATLTLGSGFDLTVTGNLDLQGALNVTSSTSRIDVVGNWLDTGSFSHGNSEVVLSGTGILGGTGTVFSTLTIAGGTRTVTASAPFTADADVTVQGGATFDLGSSTHHVAGNWNSGSPGVSVTGTGSIAFTGTGLLTTLGNALPNVKIQSGTRSVNDSSVSGNLTMTGGQLQLLDNVTLSVAGNADLSAGVLGFTDNFAGLETLAVSGSVTITATAGTTSANSVILAGGDWISNTSFAPAAGVVQLTGAGASNLDVPPGTPPGTPQLMFANLQVLSGSRNALASTQVSGDLTIASNASLSATASFDVNGDVSLGNASSSFGTGGVTHTVAGSWTSSGGSATGTGTIDFDGPGSLTTGGGSLSNVLVSLGVRSVSGATITGNLDQTAGELRIQDNSTLTVHGDASFTGGLLAFDNTSPGTEVLNVDGTLTGTSTVAPTSINTRILAQGNWSSSASFAPAAGFVQLSASGTNSVSGTAPSFPNLVLAAGTISFDSPVVVTGDFTVLPAVSVTSNAITSVGGNVSLAAGSTWNLGVDTHPILGSYTSLGGNATGSGVLEFTGTGLLSTGSASVAGVLISAGTRTVGDSVISGDLSMTGGTLNLVEDQTLTVAGNASLTGGTLDMPGSTAGAETLDVAGDVTLSATAGTLSAESVIACAGNWSSSVAFSPSSGTVRLDGGTTTTLGGASPTLNHLTIVDGTRTVTSPLSLAGDLVVSSGAALLSTAPATVAGNVTLGDGTASWDLGASNHTVSGSFTSSGASASGLGSLTLDADGSLATGGGAIANLVLSGGVHTVSSTDVTGDLTLSGGTLSLQSDASLTVGGNADLLAGTLDLPTTADGIPDLIDVQGALTGSATVSGASSDTLLRCAGDWNSDTVFALTAGRVELDGAGPGALGSVTPGDTLTLNDLMLVSGARSSSAPLMVSGDLTLQSGSSLVTGQAIDVTGALSLGDGTTSLDLGALTTHVVSGDVISAGGVASNGTLELASNGTLSTGSGSLDSLRVTGGLRQVQDSTLTGDLTLSGIAAELRLLDDQTLAVQGNVTLTSGVLGFQDLGFGDETLDVSGNLTQTGVSAGSTSPRSVIVCRGNWSSEASFSPAAGVVSLEGLAATSIAGGAPTFADLRVRDGVKTVASPVIVTGGLALETGATLAAGAVVSVSGDVTLGSTTSFDTSGLTHSVAGNWSTLAGNATGLGTIDFTADGTVFTETGSLPNVRVSGGTRVLANTTISGDLDFSGGSLEIDDGKTVHVLGDALLNGTTLSWNATPPAGPDELLDVDGSVSISAAAGTTTSASVLRCGGDLTILAAFSMASGRVIVDDAVPSLVSGGGAAVVLDNLDVSGGPASNLDALVLAGDLGIANGSSLSSSATLDVNGNVSLGDGSSSWDLGGLQHTVAGNYASVGGSATSGTLQFDGPGSLNTGSGSIDNVLLSAGLHSVSAASISTDLSMTAGTLQLLDDATISVGGNLSLSSGTLSFGSGAPGLEQIDVQGDVTITCNSGSTSADSRILCAGNWSSSAVWTPSNGLVVLDGLLAQQISGSSPSFHHLQLSGGPASNIASMAVGGDLTVDSGVAFSSSAPLIVLGAVTLGDATASWSLGGQTHLVGGDWATSGASATGPGTIELTGTGSVVTGSASVANMVVSGGVRDVRDTSVTGTFSLTGGTLVIDDDQSLTVGGDALLNGGSFGFSTSTLGGDELFDVGGSLTSITAAGNTTANSVIRVAGNWSSNSAFAPAAGRVELVGVGPGSVTGVPPGSDPSFSSLSILSGDYSAANDLTLNLSSLTVGSGASLAVGARSVTVPGGVLNISGSLSVGAGGSLSLGATAAVNVSASGTLAVVGSGSNPAVVTGFAGGGWLANVNGTLSAGNFRFEQMGPTGLVIPSSATIAPFPNDLRGGTFSDPSALASSVMLDIQRAAPTEFRYVDFEDAGSVGTFNVRTFAGSPITFTNSTGNFSGAAFEQDPFGLVNWNDDATTVAFFGGTAGLEKVTIDWISTVETDISDYSLARSASASGPFSELLLVPATGPGSYQHVDLTATGGSTWYYRLSQVLTHGAKQELGNTQATPWSATLPPNMATVGPTGDFADIQSALTALSGQFLPTVLIQPGTYPAFSVTTGIIGTLRIFGDGTGPVLIDTSASSVMITGLNVAESVELSDLLIGDPASPNPAIVVSACAGTVIVDECTLDSGTGAAAASISSSDRVALQRCAIAGDPGLSLDSGSTAIAGKGSLDELILAGGSDLRLAEMGSPITTVDGTSNLTVFPGVHADLDLPETASLEVPFTVTLSGTPNATAALVFSLGVGWIDFSGNLWEMVGLADLGLGDVLLTLPLGPTGSLSFPAVLPPDGNLIGFPVVFQTVVIDPVTHHRRWSNVAEVIGVP